MFSCLYGRENIFFLPESKMWTAFETDWLNVVCNTRAIEENSTFHGKHMFPRLRGSLNGCINPTKEPEQDFLDFIS